MNSKSKFLSAMICVCLTLVLAFAIVPMFSVTASAEDGTWTLVTDASTLKAGDKVVIAAANENYALSTNQKSSNRGAVAITKSGNTVTLPADVQELTLEVGTSDGTFAFYTGSGYLYAASSGGNQLKTKSTKDVDGSWTITISDDVASVVAQGSANRNVMQYNPNNGSPLFACYASASQQSLAIYRLETSDSGDTPVETYSATFYGPFGEIEELADEVSSFYLPDPSEYVNFHSSIDYTFEGWTKGSLQGNVTTVPELYEANKVVTLDSDTKFYAVYSYFVEGVGTGNSYELHEGEVTEGYYLIVTDGSAMKAAVSSSRLSIETVTISNNTISNPDAMIVWKFEKNGDAWTLYNESVSKYAAGTGAKNKAQLLSSVTDNAKWTINDSGDFENVANKANGVNYTLRRNGNYGFATYATSTGSVPHLYKLASSGTTYYTTTPEVIEHTNPEITGASINIGDTLAMEYRVNVCSCKNADDYTMNFTMNGNAVNGVKYNKVVDGKYVFTFSNIAPQCMGDNIAAELVCGNEVVDTKAEYSVKANAEYLLATYSNNAKLVALVNDLLNYGAAAQEYRNYNTDNLVTDEDTTADIKPESTDMTLTESTDENAYFTAAGVYFDYNNKIYVKFVGNATVKINGVEVEAENGVVYTDAISATQFANVYIFELVVDGEVVQTLTYSVNSYAYAKWGTDGELTAMQKLARALYAYGKSSEGYNA